MIPPTCGLCHCRCIPLTSTRYHCLRCTAHSTTAQHQAANSSTNSLSAAGWEQNRYLSPTPMYNAADHAMCDTIMHARCYTVPQITMLAGCQRGTLRCSAVLCLDSVPSMLGDSAAAVHHTCKAAAYHRSTLHP
jgi:hypothetical protein